ncbi:MAG: acyl-CoA synthetase [Solirubrobacteraceae bacterium]
MRDATLSLVADVGRLVRRAGDEAFFAAACTRSGMLGLEPPRRAAGIVAAFARHGMIGGALGAAAVRHADRIAIRDDRRELTYGELERRSNALACAWRARGLRAGDGIAILVRNHAGFLEAGFAAAKCGAKVVLLNTSFAGPQIREVAAREGVDLLVCDDEYMPLLDGLELRLGRCRAWVEAEDRDAPDTLEALIASGDPGPVPKPARPPRVVILTSGTTGTPKGAPRDQPKSLGLIGGLLSRVPLRARETTVLAVPLFHAFGFASMVMGLALGSTLVVRRRFDPAQTLDDLQSSRATALIVVPVMLQRILDLGSDRVRAAVPPPLRVIFVSGSAVGAPLAIRALDAFGPVLYNMYGSTEVAYATIATPRDLAAEPGTVGTPVRGVAVRIVDADGRPLPIGETGRIFVANSIQFEGYTDGQTKETIGGLMSSGDVGHFDSQRRLYIDGRDDEMIVSGGENVFPGEVEELLCGHEAIAEAAVTGVPDSEFGQRLRAFVVARPGATLDEDAVKAYVRDNLARFKVPREVVFLDELPRNPTGKVLKRELRAPVETK